jgi:hypothetical protein
MWVPSLLSATVTVALVTFSPAGFAQEDELERLRQMAEREAEKEEGHAEEGRETEFKALGLNLQQLNPEISVTGDIFCRYTHQEGTRERANFLFRTLGIHVESYLDPYTKLKAAVPVNAAGAAIGEAYMTRFSLLKGLSITAGKFRQQLGVVNRWHKHGLDQVDFPLALKEIFGPGGLNQTGVSVDWSMPPLLGSSQELTVQVTNGENARLFGGNTLSTPSVLAHFKSYRDLSKDTYLELGLTGLLGWNDEWAVGTDTLHDSLSTRVFGCDLSLLWEPTEKMRYRNVEWRSELYFLNRDIHAPDDGDRDTINSWGFYSYLQSKVTRTLIVGLRFDLYKPDHKTYATAGLAPLAYADEDDHRWQVGPYLTWFQSPFVHLRLEHDHAEGHGMRKREDVVYLQAIFAAGPHKHERY